MTSIIYEGIIFYDPIQPKDSHSKYHGRTSYRTLNGLLKREPCEICGNIKTHCHHENYEENKIRWLCCKHHLTIHKLLFKANGGEHWTVKRKRLAEQMKLERETQKLNHEN